MEGKLRKGRYRLSARWRDIARGHAGDLACADVRWGLLSPPRSTREDHPRGRARHCRGVGSAARAQAFADTHGIPRAHGPCEALLAGTEVETVYVSLPNALHAEWAIRALEAGKHVLVEKPFAGVGAEAEAAFNAAARADRVLMEGLMWRFHPQAAVLAALARASWPGSRAPCWGSTCPAGPTSAGAPSSRPGGPMDVGCYCLSAMRLLCGEPCR